MRFFYSVRLVKLKIIAQRLDKFDIYEVIKTAPVPSFHTTLHATLCHSNGECGQLLCGQRVVVSIVITVCSIVDGPGHPACTAIAYMHLLVGSKI